MINYKSKAVVLGISGNGLGIVRSLGRRGVEVVVVSDTDCSANLFSRYISEKWFLYGSESALVDELLIRGESFTEKPVLFPVRDATVLALADRLDEVRRYYHLVMPPSEIVKKSLCKTTFYQMAEEFGLSVPRTFSVKNQNEISELPADVKYPVIVKPEYRSDSYIANVSGKAFIAKNKDDMFGCYGNFSEYQAEAIIQEYIPGSDSDLYFCFQYYKKNNNLTASLCGRKIRQYPPSCGSTSSCEVVRNPEVEEITTRFFKKIDYVGPCSMELKRDPRDGRFYLIEPTVGRLDWNNAFAEGNGLPIPFMNYLDALDLPSPEFKPKKVSRRWIRWSADCESAKIHRNKGELSFMAWLLSIRPPVTWAIFSLDDPSPIIMGLFSRVKRKLGSLIKKGTFKTIKKKFRKIFLFEKYIIFSRDLKKIPSENKLENLYFREPTVEDIMLIAEQFSEHFGSSPVREITHRLSSGEMLVAGSFLDNPKNICYLAWLSKKDTFFRSTEKVKDLSKSICLYRIYVPKSHRNKGIGKFAFSYIENKIFNLGCTEILAYVSVNNGPSLNIFRKSDWGESGILYRLVLFGKEFTKSFIK